MAHFHIMDNGNAASKDRDIRGSRRQSAARHALALEPAAVLLARETPLDIASEEIQVWGFDLNAAPETVQACRRLLSPEELLRAERFVFEPDRRAYLVSHAVLRVLVGSYLRRPPHTLRWAYGVHGKPSLPADAADGVSFNLTHSGGRALLAVSDGCEVGVDLEQHRPIEVAGVGQYFYGSERAAILEAADPETAFFDYWTAKEAVLKGCGAGLSLPLDRFAVQFDAGMIQATVHSCDRDLLDGDWTVQTLGAGQGWSAAVAARGSAWRAVPQVRS